MDVDPLSLDVPGRFPLCGLEFHALPEHLLESLGDTGRAGIPSRLGKGLGIGPVDNTFFPLLFRGLDFLIKP